MTRQRKILLGAGAGAFAIGIIVLVFGLIAVFTGGNNDDRGVTQNIITITPSPVPTITPKPITPTPSPTPVPSPPLGDSPYEMVIDKIGVDAPVQAYGLDANQVPEVPTGPGQGPGQIVAWYNFSSKPGTGGNAVFAGHVTWNGLAVFYNLTSLVKGDEIKLKGQDGTVLTYMINDIFDVDATDPNAVQVMGPTSTDTITILTCDGTTTYVGGQFGVEYNNRLVVRAGLESVTLGTAVAAAGSSSGG